MNVDEKELDKQIQRHVDPQTFTCRVCNKVTTGDKVYIKKEKMINFDKKTRKNNPMKLVYIIRCECEEIMDWIEVTNVDIEVEPDKLRVAGFSEQGELVFTIHGDDIDG